MTDTSGAGPSPNAAPPARPRRRRRVVRSIAVVLALLGLVVGGGVLYLRSKLASIPRVDVSDVLHGGAKEPATTAPAATAVVPGSEPAGSGATGPATSAEPTEPTGSTQPINILLVGVDSAQGLAADDPVRAEREKQGVGTTPRPDTVLLARVDQAKGQVSLVSFPRDLWVTVNAAGRHDRLNAATSDGGAAQLITTVTTNFSVPIDHYVQVDFDQFKRLVAVIGGVTVAIDKPLRDTHSGLYLPDPGCVKLSPDDALAFARSRYMEYRQDGAWVSDPTSDLGRISRQQDFLVAALKGVLSSARNPITLNRLLDRAVQAVVLDDAFSPGDIAGLAYSFRSYDPARTERYSLPVTADTIDGKAVLRLREVSAQPVLDVFRGIEPVRAEPGDVTFTLQDGGAGAEVVERTRTALVARGFTVTVGSRTASEHTVLSFPLGQRPQAEALARNLTAPLQFDLDDAASAPVRLVVAADFGGVEGASGTGAAPVGVSSRRVGATADVALSC